MSILTDVQFNLAAYLQGKFPYDHRYRGGYGGVAPTTTTASPKATVSNQTIDDTMAALNKGFADLMGDVEKVVGTDDNHLFGRWLQEAKDASPQRRRRASSSSTPSGRSPCGAQRTPLASTTTPRSSGTASSVPFTFPAGSSSLTLSAIPSRTMAVSSASLLRTRGTSIELIEGPAAETLQNETFAVDPTTSLEDTYDVIVAMADKYVPNWRGDASWADDAYEVHTNVKVFGASPIFSTWTGMATSQHVMCSLLPDCTAFVPSLGSPFGGAMYAFSTPNVTAGGSATVYIKKAKKA